MKILITTDWYEPVINGVVTSVLNLRKELENRGHEVRILTLSMTSRSFCKEGVTYLCSVDAGKIYPSARLRLIPARRYIRKLVGWKPDIIHSQCELSTFFIAKKMAEQLQIPLIHTYHTVYEEYTHYFSPSRKWGKKAVSQLTKWISKRTDCMIAPTKKVERLLTGYGVDCPVAVVPTGINMDQFYKTMDRKTRDSLRRKISIPEDAFVLTYVGRLAKEKNLEEILSYIMKLNQDKLIFLIAGDGPYRSELEELCRELDVVDKVRFTGMVSREQVSDFYKLGDIFVSASSSETQGLTYIEALASGLPLLCRADECLNGLVESGKNGWQYHSEEEFRDKLQLFYSDEDLRINMESQAVEATTPYTSAVFAETVERIYYETIDRKKMSCYELSNV